MTIALLAWVFAFFTAGLVTQHFVWIAIQLHHKDMGFPVGAISLESKWWIVIRVGVAWSWPFMLLAIWAVGRYRSDE